MIKLPNPLKALRQQVIAVQGYVPPEQQKPPVCVLQCVVSGKHIQPEDRYVTDGKGRAYLVTEIATEKYLKENLTISQKHKL